MPDLVDEHMNSSPGTDDDIIGAIKMLEGLESGTSVNDIDTYKTNTRKLFEQLLLKLEENSDHIYSLEHRVKFLEQECEDKDLEIEKMSAAMQAAVHDCRQEAEHMVGELMGKVSAEVNQRHQVEGLVRRLQADNSKMKDYAALQKVPGWEKSLDRIIADSVLKETHQFDAECDKLRAAVEESEQKLLNLQLQREAEMNATVAVIKFAQDKIETLHMQLKIQQKKEQQELQQHQKGNRRKGKKNSNNFSTPQKESLGGDSATTTPASTPSASPGGDSKKSISSDDKALHKRSSRGKKGGRGGIIKTQTVNSTANSSNTSESQEKCEGGDMMVDVPSTPTSPAGSDNNDNKEEKVTPEILRQKSKSIWAAFRF